MNENIQNLMRDAARLTRSGQLLEATAAIQRALRGAAGDSPPARTHAVPAGWHAARARQAAPVEVLDGCVFETNTATETGASASVSASPSAPPATATAVHDLPVRPSPTGEAAAASPQVAPPQADADRSTDRPSAGRFIAGTHTEAGLTRRYKLYLPPGAAPGPRPLVVMLHGCTQDPDDFAAGTGMNRRTAEQGFVVLYPAQSTDANPQRCWNWFKHNHQRRGAGEPALIAGMTQAVMREHSIDPDRVYIAGLSAGGAMAAIVGAAYPEIFAAVGVHSGLPAGAATDLAGALALMSSGAAGATGLPPRAPRNGAAPPPAAGLVNPINQVKAVPTIVFHGDQDKTVHPRNGEQVIHAALADGIAATVAARPGAARVEQGVSVRGRRYTRSSHHSAEGLALAEHWLVHGAGHAWSGGDAAGSYTDTKGPDATQEMLRFFFAQTSGTPR